MRFREQLSLVVVTFSFMPVCVIKLMCDPVCVCVHIVHACTNRAQKREEPTGGSRMDRLLRFPGNRCHINS